MESLHVLAEALIEIKGRMPWSSNATFLCDLTLEDSSEVVAQAIYKPHRGERPLWDFPSGLYQREVAAYRLSAALGWGGVPPTVVRDGPFGVGSLQLFMPANFEEHYFTIHEKREDLHDQLRAICAFDVIANNTDRKSGHCLLGLDDTVWAIDHGVCFSEDFKLRTVIWEFGTEPLPETIRPGIIAIAELVPDDLAALLSPVEIAALQRRARDLADAGTFPTDPSGRRYPWPLV
jgi:uncharacterized repeat protein (TIGR03843 family)